jgi:hypothetical protein
LPLYTHHGALTYYEYRLGRARRQAAQRTGIANDSNAPQVNGILLHGVNHHKAKEIAAKTGIFPVAAAIACRCGAM